MNRRDLLKNSLYAGAMSLIPFSKTFAHSHNTPLASEKESYAGFKKLKLGELDIYILSDGYIREPDVTTFAPLSNEDQLKALLQAHFRPIDHIDMAMNILLVKTPERLTLLDTGMGIFADEKTGFLKESLRKAGFSPADITDIFLSHAHPDHIGGVIDQQNNFVFPNAKIFIANAEHDFWMHATLADFNNSALKKQPEFLNMFIPKVQNILTTIKPRLHYYDFQKPLYDIFHFQLAPGHTPGLTITSIASGNERLLYVADLIHSDIISTLHPEWGFNGDTDLNIAATSRRKVLQELSESRTRAFAYHLSWPGLGHIKHDDRAYNWVPESFVTP